MTAGSALRLTTALGLTLAIAVSCSPSPPSPPPPAPTAPAPTPPPPPPPAPVGNWEDQLATEGAWVYREDERGSIALFGPRNSEAVFMVRCQSADRRIVFSRAGAASGGSATMGFQATHGARQYPAQNVGTGLPYITAITNGSDPYLDTLAFSRGRIAVSATGQNLLVIPNWAEMARVFEDCRG